LSGFVFVEAVLVWDDLLRFLGLFVSAVCATWAAYSSRVPSLLGMISTAMAKLMQAMKSRMLPTPASLGRAAQ
jgi:hypothetical protein